MPTYAYQCQNCGGTFERRMSMAAYAAGEAPPCPTCGSPHVERTFTAVNVLTGSRSGGGGGGAAACGPSGFG